MPYDPENDPYKEASKSLTALGTRSRVVTPSDTEDIIPYPKTIVVLSPGTLALLPVKNEDADVIRYQVLVEGQIVFWRVRRVMATGTTAIVATIED